MSVLTDSLQFSRFRVDRVRDFHQVRFDIPNLGIYDYLGESPPGTTRWYTDSLRNDMQDFNGSKRRLDREHVSYGVKPCFSTQIHNVVLAPMRSWDLGSGSGPVVPRHGVLPIFDSTKVDTELVYPFLNSHVVPLLSDLHLEAFNYFADVFPQQISSSEFVQGLFQLKDLIPKVEDTIVKSFSGGFLNKEFGWDNLLSDLSSFSTLLDTVRSRLEYLIRTRGIPQRLSFSRRLSLDSYVGGYYDELLSGNWGTRVYLQSVDCRYRATSWIMNQLDYLDGLVGTMRGITGALGLNNPLKAIWNVLPFSFVVDWFGKISEHLTSVARIGPPVGWDVYNVTHSIRMSYILRIDEVHPAAGGTPFQQWNSGTAEGLFYRRGLGLPFSLVNFDLAGLSPMQLVLMLGMLGTAS